MRKLTVLAVLMFFVSSFAFAVDKDIKAKVNGIRPMGMGGAFTAIADDENAFFYNPAGISQRESWLLQIFSLNASISGLEFWTGVLDQDEWKTKTTEEQVKLIEKGPAVFAAIPISLAFISGPIGNVNFGIGEFAYIDLSADAVDTSGDNPKGNLFLEGTLVVAAPISYRIKSLEAINLPGELSVGINIKYLYRAEGALENANLNDLNTDGIKAQYGMGYGLDLGMIYHFTPEFNFGLQLADVISRINYKQLDASDIDAENFDFSKSRTASIPTEINIGAAYTPERIGSWVTNNRLTFAADLKDLSGEFTDDFIDKLHIGAEYRFSPFAIRVGLGSGLPSIGLGIFEWRAIQISYAFYGEKTYYGKDVYTHEILFAVKLGHHDGKPFGSDVANKEEKITKEEKKAQKEQIKEAKAAAKEEKSTDKVAETKEKAVKEPKQQLTAEEKAAAKAAKTEERKQKLKEQQERKAAAKAN